MDPGVGRGGVGAVAGEDVQHAEDAQDAVETVFSGGIGAETVQDRLAHGVVGGGGLLVDRGHQGAGGGASVGVAPFAAAQLHAEVA